MPIPSAHIHEPVWLVRRPGGLRGREDDHERSS